MTTTSPAPEYVRIVQAWLIRFEAALHGTGSLAALFDPDAVWKDLFILGDQPQELAMGEGARPPSSTVLTGFHLSSTHSGPRWVERAGVASVEAFFEFRMPGGRGEGVVRLFERGGVVLAREFTTAPSTWDAAAERVGDARPGSDDDGTQSFLAPTWYEKRAELARFSGEDPEVLIVGAGQAGLSLAARLGRMGIRALVVERNVRIGDNWRHRYRALRLHNGAAVIGLPYFRVPESWENFLSKDRVANWLEYYADAMDIACWTATSLESARAADGGWIATLAMPDGSRRHIRPAHLVIATGLSGAPRMPGLPGLDRFAGELLHSSEYRTGSLYLGKPVLVIGAGSSGHDIAQDLHAHGAQVTMLQRGATTVASVSAVAEILDAGYAELPQDDADLLGASYPRSSFIRVQQEVTRRLRERDAVLLSALSAAGFAVDFGHDDTGPVLKYLRQGGGFYLNVGSSDLIARGEIAIVRGEDVAAVEPTGLRMVDGSRRDVELIVAATGFKPQRETIAALLGEEVAERLGPVWGLDEIGFPRNTWRPTAVDGLWFMLGNFAQCRFYSRLLALQLAARVRPS